MPSPRAGAWLWLMCFQFFVCEQIARLGWKGHYSMARDYISDLGAVHCAGPCSSLHLVMDASFVLQGLLIFFGALLLRRTFPGFTIVLFAIAGLGVLVVGLVPEDSNFRWHILGAVGNFLGGNIAMILVGLLRNKNRFALAAGSAGLLATLLLAFRGSPAWALPAGTVERFAAYPLPLWLSWTGLQMLRSHGAGASFTHTRPG